MSWVLHPLSGIGCWATLPSSSPGCGCVPSPHRYCLLLCGNLDEAEEQLQAGAALGERMGDAELYARCLAFLSLVFRRRGQVEEVRDYISRKYA
jgi:hypothetical protein